MPDFDPLPRRPRPPVLTPRPGDYTGVVTRAKHRRRGQMRAATGAGVAGVAAAAFLVASHGGGTYGLKPQPPAGVVSGDASEEPAPSASPSDVTPTSAAPGAGGDGSGRGAGQAGGDPVATPVPGEPGGTGAPVVVRPVVVRDEVGKATGVLCETDPSEVTATGWCLNFEVPPSVKTGGDAILRILVCRYEGRGSGTLTFDSEQQVDWMINTNPGNREEWRWSHGYPFVHRQTQVTVPEARCARWTAHWDTTDNAGDLVQPGSYYVWPEITASDWGGYSMGYDVGHGIDVTEH